SVSAAHPAERRTIIRRFRIAGKIRPGFHRVAFCVCAGAAPNPTSVRLPAPAGDGRYEGPDGLRVDLRKAAVPTQSRKGPSRARGRRGHAPYTPVSTVRSGPEASFHSPPTAIHTT